jgi:glutamate--cysteine ligase
MKDGFGGHCATEADWTTHLNTLFPEVRLKRTLEVRGADGQPEDTVVALPALWKGILHDPAALSAAEKLASRLNLDEVQSARPAIGEKALRAKLQGRDVAAWASDVLEIAESGLQRIADLDPQGNDERQYLAPLRTLIAAGESPADRLLRVLNGKTDAASVIEASRLR